MVIGVLKEVSPETRVSLIAEGVAQLTKKQISVWVESGAGLNAYCSDDDYTAAGAEIKSSQEIADKADIILSIHAPSISIRNGVVLIGMYPAKVLILGAGVAGLQAIATAKRLGAVVEVFDTRPAVKEEVQSLGAKFIEIPGAADASTAGGYAVEQSEEYKKNQQLKIAESAAKADIIITTAQIIGDSNLPATMPSDASKLDGKNILNFLQLIINKEGALILDTEDDLVKGSRALA